MCMQILGQETDGLPSDCQHVLVSQRSQCLVKQLLGDSLKTKVSKKTWINDMRK